MVATIGDILHHHDYEWVNEYANPHPHPRWVYTHRVKAAAKEYFAWELMNGSDVEKLKQDPYWRFYEEDEHA